MQEGKRMKLGVHVRAFSAQVWQSSIVRGLCSGGVEV
jgi:hypothetical protein